MSSRTPLSRRKFIRLTAGSSALAAFMAACAAPAAPAAPAQPAAEQPASAATAAPAADVQPTEAAEAPAAEAILLKRYASMEKDHFPLFEAQRKGFNEKYPNVTVEEVGVPWGEYIAKVRVLLNSGEVPDVFWFMRFGQWDPGIEAATYLQEDIIADASDVFDTKSSKHFENVVDSVRVDGKLAGLPFEVFSDGVNWMYNQELMDKAGLTAPEQNPTWDELDAWLTEAQAKVDKDVFATGKGSWLFWSAFMAASANEPGFHGMASEDITKSTISSEANVKTIAKLADWYKRHILARGDASPDHLDGMLGGKVLAAGMSTWAPTQMNTAKFPYGSFSGPRHEGVEPRVDGYTGINLWTFAKDGAHTKEAADFCYYCGAQEGLDTWAASGRFTPTNKFTVDDYVKFGKALDQIKENEKGFRQAISTNFDVVPNLKVWPIAPKVYWGAYLDKLNEVMKDVVEGKVTDETSIAELLVKAQEAGDKVLAGNIG
jgi:ABC-type glycerol-3-phosphate transport system substrate-binding protein